MLIGASLILAGILIGYSIPFWITQSTVSKIKALKIKNVFQNKNAIVIDTSVIDLGDGQEI